MTIDQIRYYVASVETGSFSGAANRLYVSHSSVSRGVAALEEELGVSLLTRGRRSLRCTPAGETFLRCSKDLLRQTVQMKDSVAKYRVSRRLSMSSIGAYMPNVYQMIRAFRETHPEIDLEMEQEDQNQVVKHLRGGETDLGVSFSYSWPNDPELASLVLEPGRFCALVPPDHPFASRAYLTREELMDCPQLLGENPFHPEEERPTADTQDIPSIIWQIKAGSGVTVLPEHAAAEFGHGCVQKPISGMVNEYQLLLVWRKSNTSAALKDAISFFQIQLNGRTKPGV